LSFPDISGDLKSAMPDLRGRLLANEPLAPLTWFRVGGPAQILFTPADEDDLAYFLSKLPQQIGVYVVGVGSNLIVRDGGVKGVVIRLAQPCSTSASQRPRPLPISADWNSFSESPAPLVARCG
jgi:UDP-N-acetylmuramate dehydrogenase